MTRAEYILEIVNVILEKKGKTGYTRVSTFKDKKEAEKRNLSMSNPLGPRISARVIKKDEK
jgi:hypothetical protein